MSYNFRVKSFSDGSTTFDGSAAGVNAKTGSADGPTVIPRMVANDAGAIIDLDGTGPATLVPPIVTASYISVAANPDAHAQYKNLMALKGKHGTLTGHIPGASANVTKTVAARLIEVTANWDGAHRIGKSSWLAFTAKWQLKGFIS